MDELASGNFFYCVVSLSEKDVLRIKNLLLDQLKENLKNIGESKEEKLYGLNIDFYNLARKSQARPHRSIL